MKFKSKVAIVSGAGQGIGYEICRELIAQGCKVVLNDIDESLSRSASQQLSGKSNNCISVFGDASSEEVIDKMIQTARNEFGKLDIVVANAGVTHFGDFLNYKREDFRKILRINLEGSYFLVQAASRLMKSQKTGGSILLMSSVTGHQAHENLSAYAMSKAALEMLARNLVIELSPYQININCLAPGATLTERTEKIDPEYGKTWSGITPLGRPANCKDIAAAALFILSDEARHITGQTIVIDGGWTAVSPSPFRPK